MHSDERKSRLKVESEATMAVASGGIIIYVCGPLTISKAARLRTPGHSSGEEKGLDLQTFPRRLRFLPKLVTKEKD